MKGRIEMAPNSTFSFDVNDYVVSPRGTPISITVAESLAASPGPLTVAPDSASRLTLTSTDGYTGPGAVVFEVRDGAHAQEIIAALEALDYTVERLGGDTRG